MTPETRKLRQKLLHEVARELKNQGGTVRVHGGTTNDMNAFNDMINEGWLAGKAQIDHTGLGVVEVWVDRILEPGLEAMREDKAAPRVKSFIDKYAALLISFLALIIAALAYLFPRVPASKSEPEGHAPKAYETVTPTPTPNTPNPNANAFTDRKPDCQAVAIRTIIKQQQHLRILYDIYCMMLSMIAF